MRACLNHLHRPLLLLAATASPLLAQASGRPPAARDTAVHAAAPEPIELGGYVSTRLEATRSPAVTRFVLRRAAGELEANRGRFHLEGELELESGVPSAFLDEKREEEHELEVEQATLSYVASPALSLRAGLLLPPLGRLNAHNEDWLWDLPQRPLIDRAVPVLPARAAWKAAGAGAVWTRRAGRLGRVAVAAYLLTPTDQQLQVLRPAAGGLAAEAIVHATDDLAAGGSAPRAVAARLSLASSAGSELAFAAHAGPYARDLAGRRATAWTLGLDGRRALGAFVIEGEALWGRYARVEDVLRGFVRAAADSLTGDNDRVLLEGLAGTRSGFWLDLERPIALGSVVGRQPARLIPVVRYEQVHLGDAVTGFILSGDDVGAVARGSRAQERISAGVAFRPLPQLVLHAVGERARALRGPLLEPASDRRSVAGLYLGLAWGLGD